MSDKLIDELRGAAENMNKQEIGEFRKELKRRIGPMVHYAAERATRSIEEKEKEGD